MNARFFVLMNHTLTPDQQADALDTLGGSGFVDPPPSVSRIWAAIPADADSIGGMLSPVKIWLDETARSGDTVLIQGDFGAVFHMVCYAFSKDLIPVYATTERAAVETLKDDGSVEITRVFRHRRFRRYENLNQG